MVCGCGGTDVEYDHVRGDTACTSCGTVLSENQIVTELGFVQDAAGSSSMVGQFVPASGSNQLGSGARGQRSGMMLCESREVTIARGRFKIQQIAMALTMNRHHVDAAHRLFMLAVQHNFIQGRKTDHVVAACLYIVCRREKTQHLLIDFSDVLQENVYVLGKTFMKFVRLLNITMPIIDPSLFVHRFAARLEFDDKTHLVAMTALRLVARMCRDWMAIGRRPGGICGAALMISARIHGFRRSQKEVGRVVKICESTLRKRVMEFIETPSSRQTVAEFNDSTEDFAAEMNPPSFPASSIMTSCLDECRKGDDEEMDLEADAQKDIDNQMRDALNSSEMRDLELEFQSCRPSNTPPVLGSNALAAAPAPPSSSASGGGHALRHVNGDDADVPSAEHTNGHDGGSDVEEVGEDGRPIVEESISDGDSSDEEVSRMILSRDESVCKEKIWMELNEDYFRQQEIKRKWEEDQIALGLEPISVRKKRRKTKAAPAKTPAEATMNALKQKSSKINYDVLKNLFDANALSKPAPPSGTQQQLEDIEEEDEEEDDEIVVDESGNQSFCPEEYDDIAYDGEYYDDDD